MVSFSWYTDFAINYYSWYIDNVFWLIQEYVSVDVILQYVVFIVVVVGISWILSVLFTDFLR